MQKRHPEDFRHKIFYTSIVKVESDRFNQFPIRKMILINLNV